MTTHLTDEAERELLRTRARALARPDAQGAADGGTLLRVLEFRLGNERYAVEAACVHEVHPLRNLTPIPCTPDFVLGVVAVRGQIFTVMDLRRILGLAQEGLTDLHRVILLGRDAVEFGILADISVGVRDLPEALLQGVPLSLAGHEGGLVRGATPDGLVLLDARAMLEDPRMTIDDDFEDDNLRGTGG